MSTIVQSFKDRLPASKKARHGLILIVVVLLVTLGLAFKSQIKARVKPGDTITAEFSENYNLKPYTSKVKMAGLQIGIVTKIDYTDHDTALVTMKVDSDAAENFGDAPSARIAPLTILGGQYSVEISHGGDGAFAGATIPVARTAVPVELDKVLAALPENTRAATQGTVKKLNKTLADGGGKGLRGLLDQAPTTLPPAGTFVDALRGLHPQHDLTDVVSYLQDAAQVLDKNSGVVDQMLVDLDTTTGVLAASSGDLATTIDGMPETLKATDAGVTKLNGTLTKLGESTTKLKPTINKLDPLLDVLEPTLVEALPTVKKLPPLLQDARVIVNQLVPTSVVARKLVNDVRGPVLDRVNGPIIDYLGHTWHGKAGGPYEHSGGGIQAENKMYEELAYMIVNLDRSSMTQDPQGTLLNFQAGVGTSTLQPIALDEALADLLPMIDLDWGQG